jgi:flagellar motor switch protein FliN
MADESLEDAWAGALEDQGAGADGADEDWASALADQDGAGGMAQSANFNELGDGSLNQAGTQNLDFLLDIPLNISVELGRTTMIINKMLQLTQGSVVELDKAAGDSVDIYVNNKLLGKGEVIVVNDRFGVRITEIISQAERIRNMG